MPHLYLGFDPFLLPTEQTRKKNVHFKWLKDSLQWYCFMLNNNSLHKLRGRESWPGGKFGDFFSNARLGGDFLKQGCKGQILPLVVVAGNNRFFKVGCWISGIAGFRLIFFGGLSICIFGMCK